MGVRPKRPFLHRIGGFGSADRVTVAGLPPGLTFDPHTRLVTGRTSTRGSHRVSVHVDGTPSWSDALEILVGDTICLTPPLGWNSWNAFGPMVTENDVRDAGAFLVDSGLADLGWTQVNVDDGWQGTRDRAGRLRPNEKFRDLGALCADLHEVGLKVGIYSSPGQTTCGGFAGSAGHERDDAESFAEWGFDYLKHDWCSAGPHGRDTPLEDLIGPYRVMRDELDRLDRDIVYHLCQYGLGEVWRWAREQVGANAWRTTGDIEDTWASVDGIGFGQAGLADFAGPGGWNDPDMLVVGSLGGGWNRPLAPTRLTPDEERTHLSLWAMLAAPMLLGCDMTTLPERTVALLSNRELLAIHQDIEGRQARRRRVDGDVEIWVRTLADRSAAIGVFNRGARSAETGCEWAALGLAPRMRAVRDVWSGLDLDAGDGWHGTLPPHGSTVLRARS